MKQIQRKDIVITHRLAQKIALAPSIDRAMQAYRSKKKREDAENQLSPREFVVRRKDGSYVERVDPVTFQGTGEPQVFRYIDDERPIR